jgi:ADP-ribosylglycohydrolase
VEFLTVRQIVSRYGAEGIRDYVEHPDNTGEFTDDTQMTLFTAEALIRAHQKEVTRGIRGGLAEIALHSFTGWLYTQGEKPRGMFTDSPDGRMDRPSWGRLDRG